MQRSVPGGERGLQQVRGVHRAARGRAGADHRVDLVDEHDRVRVRLDLLDRPASAAPRSRRDSGCRRAACPCRARTRSRRRAPPAPRRCTILRARPFGDRGLADAGVADEQRVVLLAAAQDLDRALHLGLAADQRVDLAVARLLVEVDAVGVERVALLLRAGLVLVAARTLGRIPPRRRAAGSALGQARGAWRCRG